MNWFKIHHGLTQDARLAVVARRAGFRRGEALALWVSLMEYASRAAPRGSVGGIDAEEIAIALEFDLATVEAALLAFREKNMIQEDGKLVDWERKQRNSTPRVRLSRAARQAEDMEPDAARRARLQAELMERHRRRGKELTETTQTGGMHDHY